MRSLNSMPAPIEVKAIEGYWKMARQLPPVKPMTAAPFAALAFKIATDPFVGTLTFFRVYSGTLKSAITFITL